MKRKLLMVITWSLGAAVAATVYAQNRHDEKPHGSAKSTVVSSGGGPVIGMRHDERPHGQKKPATGKPELKPAAGAKP